MQIRKILRPFVPIKLRRIIKSFKRTSPKYHKSLHSNSNTLNGLVAYNKYGGYFTPISSQHRPAVQEILKGKVYEPETVKFICDNCGMGDIIHAGTYYGDFLPALSAAASGDATIWAFEPNPENFRCAQITLLINDIKNVILANTALGELESSAKMLVESEAGIGLGGASKIIRNAAKGKIIDIRIVRIDDVVPHNRNISILHLDVEGYEKEALQGGLETINRCRPILILEDKNDLVSTDWFADYILALGYEIKKDVHWNKVLAVNP